MPHVGACVTIVRKVKIIRVISLNLNSFETAKNGERVGKEGIKIEKRHLRSFLLFFGTSYFGRPLLAVVKCNPAASSTFAERRQRVLQPLPHKSPETISHTSFNINICFV